MTQTWTCDTCGQPIEKAKDGWVEWISIRINPRKWIVRKMRLVHYHSASPRAPYGTCQFNEHDEYSRDRGILGDCSLLSYTGDKGLADLLGHLADPDYADVDVFEMLKRIQVPGYETGMDHLPEAVQEGLDELNQAVSNHAHRKNRVVLEDYHF